MKIYMVSLLHRATINNSENIADIGWDIFTHESEAHLSISRTETEGLIEVTDSITYTVKVVTSRKRCYYKLLIGYSDIWPIE